MSSADGRGRPQTVCAQPADGPRIVCGRSADSLRTVRGRSAVDVEIVEITKPQQSSAVAIIVAVVVGFEFPELSVRGNYSPKVGATNLAILCKSR